MRKVIFLSYPVLILSSLLLVEKATAQSLPDSVILKKSISSAIETYHVSQGVQSPIYNGVEHLRYLPSIEGIAYFLTDQWQPATINYDGIIYSDLSALYDIVKDEVVINLPSRIPIVPYVGKINGFSLPGHVFVRMDKRTTPSLKTGFYEQFVRGNITVLIKRQKLIDEKINGTQVDRKFVQQDKYYIVKDNIYYSVSGEKDIEKALFNHRNEVAKYLNDNELHFRTNPDNTIIKAIEYYNQLSNP